MTITVFRNGEEIKIPVTLDASANDAHAARITTAGSRVSAWVVPTNEELMIARHTSALLGLAARQGSPT